MFYQLMKSHDVTNADTLQQQQQQKRVSRPAINPRQPQVNCADD